MSKEEIKEAFVNGRTKAVSEMLDNPFSNGIYKTSNLYEQLDNLFETLFELYAQQQSIEFAEWIGSKYKMNGLDTWELYTDSFQILSTKELYQLFLNQSK